MNFGVIAGPPVCFFILNIPMGGMIVLMVQTNSGFSYPGYLIYLSALYTLYMMALSVINLVRSRKMDSPILICGQNPEFVSAMMSVLGLQTAMSHCFSTMGEGYRKMMNAITGGVVFFIVMVDGGRHGGPIGSKRQKGGWSARRNPKAIL